MYLFIISPSFTYSVNISPSESGLAKAETVGRPFGAVVGTRK